MSRQSQPPISPPVEGQRKPTPSMREELAARVDRMRTPPQPAPAPAPRQKSAPRAEPAPNPRPAAQRASTTPDIKASPAAATQPEPELVLRHMPDEAVDRLSTFAATRRKSMAMPSIASLKGRGELWNALVASRDAIKWVGLFSLVINVLMLAGPLFMLQVYDRVMTSGSLSTLFALALLTTVAYGVIGMLELVRSRVVTRIGREIDQRIGDRVFEAGIVAQTKSKITASSALRELDTLRGFIAGPAPMTVFDGMWTPVYLLVIFMVHWLIGLAAVVGAGVLIACAWLTESRSRAPLTEAQKSVARSLELAESGQRNADALRAMGMVGHFRAHWQKLNDTALAWQILAADRLGGMSAVSKTMRLLLQSMMLAIGAALAVRGDISAGAIIACTIIFGRALAPVEQGVTHWRGAVKAHDSYKKLEQLLAANPQRPERTSLPKPRGNIDVQGLRVAAPETKNLILAGVSFSLVPGKMLAVIGPSASGKSTLVRALTGLWSTAPGQIRIDGASLDQWNPDDLGKHFGYLPQDTELFSGSLRNNIARFDDTATDAEVVAAAKAAHAHDLIMALPQGYDTELGAFGSYLSGGQKQRVALARALFRNPPIVVLDEPNANLDRAGDEALAAAIDDMRARGQAVVLVSHRVQAIGKADLLLYLEKGVQRAFGPKNDVLKLLNGEGGGQAKPQQAQPANAPQQAKPQAGASPQKSSQKA